MRLTRRADLQDLRCSAFTGFRFPPEVIALAVGWYLRFGLSYRDVEELLAERGTDGDTLAKLMITHNIGVQIQDT